MFSNNFSKKNRLLYKMKYLNTRNSEYENIENDEYKKIEKYNDKTKK